MNIPRKKKSSLLSRLALWSLLALAVLFVAGFIAVRIWFFSYLKSPAFCNLIGGITSKQIKAEGEYQPFNFSDSALYSDGFKARGTSAAAFSDLRADQLRAQINLAGLWRHAWQIDTIDIQRLHVALAQAGGAGPAAAPQEVGPDFSAAPSTPRFKWLPDHVDLRKLIIHDTNLNWGENTVKSGSVSNAECTITPDGDAWNIVCDSGTLSQQGMPDLAINQADLRYQRSALYITDADLRYNSDSGIDLSGEVDFGKSFNVLAKLNSIPVTPLLRPDWRAKLKGNLSGTVNITSQLPMTGAPDMEGDLSLAQGEVEALPVLDEIATFTSTERFRRFEITRFTAHFDRTDSLLKVTHLIAESEGLIRMEGDFTVQNGLLDGTFQVGVTTSSLVMLPAALQNAVFTTSHGGYEWTTVHLSGPVDHLSEDLSSRLISATRGAIIDTAKGIINQVPGAGTATEEGKKLINNVLSPLFGN